VIFFTARAVGDPHLVTFGRLNYTFNGYGEYWMVKTENIFLQARMRPMVSQSWIYFTNILRAAFIHEDLKIAKNSQVVSLFVLLVAVHTRKMWGKLTPWCQFHPYIQFFCTKASAAFSTYM